MRIGGEAHLRLGHADREAAITGLLIVSQFAGSHRGERDVGRTIDFGGNRADLVHQLHLVRIDRREIRHPRLDALDHRPRQRFRPLRAIGPMGAQRHLHPHAAQGRVDHGNLGIGVRGETVEGDDHRQAEALHVLHMAQQIDHATLHRLGVFPAQIGLGDIAVHLQRPHRAHHHRTARLQPAHPAFDVEEFLAAQIGPEARFRDNDIGQFHRRAGGDQRIAAMGDIGERPAMHQGRRALQRLHQIGLQGGLQQHRHRAIGLQIGRRHRLALPRLRHHDAPQTGLQIGQIGGEAEHRHHFGGNRDIKPILAHRPIGAAHAGDDGPQRTVIHVHHPLPGDLARVDTQRVAVMQMVVDQRREQVMRAGDGVEIAGEM